MKERPALRALAADAGILDAYVGNDGATRHTTERAFELLLRALGYDASTDDGAARALARRKEDGRRPIPRTEVVREGSAGTSGISVRLRSDQELRAAFLEREGREEEELPLTGTHGRRSGVALGPPLPWGRHRLRLVLRSPEGDEELGSTRIVVPERACDVTRALGAPAAWGVWANLYAVRGDSGEGAATASVLADLARWTAGRGGHFVGTNPLHDSLPDGSRPSPYAPSTRLFRNPLYLDLERVPELEESHEARALLDGPARRRERARLRAAEAVPYREATAWRRPVLEALHRTFRRNHRGRGTPRGRAYEDWTRESGEALGLHATWTALRETLERPHWEWPASLRDARSAAVERWRGEHEAEVDFHAWCQFELDRQLGEAATAGQEAGLRLGLYTDLALASARDGSDAWAHPGLVLEGVELGAPPDAYAPEGQRWGLPPLHPERLREDGYAFWSGILRAAFRHAGALRVDHVMGLFRQFFFPVGEGPEAAAYVRFPARDLLGLLALESRRASAVVVGEDLGTVPRGLPSRLGRRSILSTRVLYFERDRRGRFRSASGWSKRALATATTHDHVPVAGFCRGRDLVLRREALAIADDEELGRRLRERRTSCAALLRRLDREGLLGGASPSREIEVVAPDVLIPAVYAFLARTPAPLVGVALDDLAGETEPMNLPGVPDERHPAWRRRQAKALSEILTGELARRIVASLGTRSLSGAGPQAPERASGPETSARDASAGGTSGPNRPSTRPL